VALLPRSFQVFRGAPADVLGPRHSVRVIFDAAKADELGFPDLARTFSGEGGGEWASEAAQLNAEDRPSVRFRVEFDLAAGSGPADPGATPPSADFLRMPFRFWILVA